MLGYEFVTLDKEQKASRRYYLGLYGTIAQWSVLCLLFLVQLSFLARWVLNSYSSRERPRSPHPRAMTLGEGAWNSRAAHKLTRLRWWADEAVQKGWFTNGQLILGLVWTVWLMFLCVHNTGNDYLHLTKRFGIVAASQLPLHYILAMRSAYSPIQLLTRLSYDQVIAIHELLGKILALFFGLHAMFYLNFFVQAGVLSKRIREVDVITGLIGFAMFGAMSSTALSFVRNWNYRVFYTTHVLLAVIVIDVLIFHVSHIRTYAFEMLAAFVLLQILRQSRIHQFSGSVVLIPGTDLVQITVPLPFDRDARAFKPGQHVHLSRPALGALSYASTFALRYRTNPFTIASLPAKDKQLLLVARTLNGNTKHLAKLAQSLQAAENREATGATSIPLTIEGPYGPSSDFPDFNDEFDTVLIVAGGVGATFGVPVFRSIVEGGARSAGLAPPRVLRARVRFVWAVRRLAETRWAFPKQGDEEADGSAAAGNQKIDIFVTRGGSGDVEDDDGRQGLLDDDVELAEGMREDKEAEKVRGRTVAHGRPDLRALVEETFAGSTGSVAVLTCGPESMVADLRRHVKGWVYKGRDVFWHAESFGL